MRPSASPVLFGTTLTVTVNAAGSLGTVTGSVKLAVDDVAQGGFVTLVNGAATFSGIPVDATTGLVAGNHLIGILYSGNATYLPQASSMNDFPLVVCSGAAGVACIAVTPTPSPVTFGGTLTVGVSTLGSGGIVTGTVKLAVDDAAQGGFITLVNGAATFMVPVNATTTLVTGKHSIGVLYSGDVWPPSVLEQRRYVDRHAVPQHDDCLLQP